MTLTAIDKDFRLLNPSVLVESGLDEDVLATRMRKIVSDGLYCPHCHCVTGRLFPVRYRNAKKVRKHFFHVDNKGDRPECANWTNESEDHFNAKAAIAHSLQNRYPDQIKAIQIEQVLKKGSVNRKPDILVTYNNGSLEAHEVQLSPITSKEILARTADLEALGCRVNWYLGSRVYSRANRSTLNKKGAPCHWIFQDDEERWRWQLDQGIDEAPEILSKVSRKDAEERKQCDRKEEKVARTPPPSLDEVLISQGLLELQIEDTSSSGFDSKATTTKAGKAKAKKKTMSAVEKQIVRLLEKTDLHWGEEVALRYFRDRQEYWVRGYEVFDPDCGVALKDLRYEHLPVVRVNSDHLKPVQIKIENISKIIPGVEYYTFEEVFGSATRPGLPVKHVIGGN